MAEDLIRYDLLVQDAMRSVVRKVLADVEAAGYLPGDHHFTISFRTDAPGVKISRRLKEQWPRELTIILQHQYSNLEVDEAGFGVSLSFRGVPENLYVPFDAVTGFFDPSVEFGLRFESADAPTEETQGAPAPIAAKPAAAQVDAAPAKESANEIGAAQEQEDESRDAKVVSIDAFRKKT
ncbi:MAG: ClpXP protease specificity-enhancing factor SspB [Methylocystis sp.]|nr:ClpXP protease specificity-enhancing factor SspB [Methylocystis sp.]